MIAKRVLIVDDDRMTTEAYTSCIKNFGVLNEGYRFKVDAADSCDTALPLIKSNKYDIAFLDVRLPASKDGNYKSGVDLAKLIQKSSKSIKILIITGHYDVLFLGRLLRNLNPDGLLFKGDAGFEMVSDALTSILSNIPFYSPTILKLLRKKISSNIILSENDKLLIYELAKGTKTKDLSKVLPLSTGGIESRKRFLKELFDTKGKKDSALIKAAKNKGFI